MSFWSHFSVEQLLDSSVSFASFSHPYTDLIHLSSSPLFALMSIVSSYPSSLSALIPTSLPYAFSISCPVASSCFISCHQSNLLSTSSLSFAFSLLQLLFSALSLVPSLVSLLPVSSIGRDTSGSSYCLSWRRDGRRTVSLWPIRLHTFLLC